MFDTVPWSPLRERLRHTWKQGEHAIIIAPTGRGKTVLIQEVQALRRNVVMFGTKTYDSEYLRLIRDYGYTRARTWPLQHDIDRALLWPSLGPTMKETRDEQKRVFTRAINDIFRNGKWTVVFDELHWIAQSLGLYEDIAHLHHQGRSSKLTLIDGFQRPAFVPVIVYSSATHVFVWGTNHGRDLDTLRSVGKLDALSKREITEVFGRLEKHQFVYVNTSDQHAPVISKVER